ncbi:hypothetical protein A9498_29000 (plasmid) [Bacillus thuringiensis serovar coreanensis]|nr:hypothetical protein A9498_29000 [Bacillus thuringiensis serovar coreanensis]
MNPGPIKNLLSFSIIIKILTLINRKKLVLYRKKSKMIIIFVILHLEVFTSEYGSVVKIIKGSYNIKQMFIFRFLFCLYKA